MKLVIVVQAIDCMIKAATLRGWSRQIKVFMLLSSFYLHLQAYYFIKVESYIVKIMMIESQITVKTVKLWNTKENYIQKIFDHFLMDKWYNVAHLSFVVLVWPLKCHTKDRVIKTLWNIMPSEINCKMHFNFKKLLQISIILLTAMDKKVENTFYFLKIYN